MILDLRAALDAGLFSGEAERAAEAAAGGTLNPLMALGAGAAPRIAPAGLRAARRRRSRTRQGRAARRPPAASRRRLLAASAGGDRQFHRFFRRHPSRREWRTPPRPEQPARARITNTSPSPITAAPRRCANRTSRCAGRTASASCRTRTRRAYGPCRNLDYELELAVWIGPGNRAGRADPDRARPATTSSASG